MRESCASERVELAESLRRITQLLLVLLLIGGVELNPGPVFETQCELCSGLYKSIAGPVEEREQQLSAGERKLQERETLLQTKEDAFREREREAKEILTEREEICMKVEASLETREKICIERENLISRREQQIRTREVSFRGEVLKEGPQWRELISLYGLNAAVVKWAAEQGHVSLMEALLERSPRTDWVKEAFLLAVNKGQLEIFQLLLQHHRELVISESQEALDEAAREGHLGIMEALLKAKPLLTVSEVFKIAAEKNHLPIIKFLLQHRRKHVRTSSALLSAAREGHVDIVRYLIDTAKTKPSVESWSQNPLLHLSAQRGHLELVQYLIAEGIIAPGVQNKNEKTPLHLAAEAGHLEVVRFLVTQAKAPVNTCDCDGKTPLQLADSKDHHQVVAFLIGCQQN